MKIYDDYQVALANKHPMLAWLFEMEYGLLSEKEQASSCIACGQCATHCPQHIDIPHWMETIRELHMSMKSA
jgi:predicted aldo/keto reductase-like oxidoreductase